jgi:hypothetical protein
MGPLKKGVTRIMVLNKLLEELYGVCCYKKDETRTVRICFCPIDWELSKAEADYSITVQMGLAPLKVHCTIEDGKRYFTVGEFKLPLPS